ncbi:hypothetical protein JCM30760_24690 [Thiomicrorhabdus hydrogeniphila]
MVNYFSLLNGSKSVATVKRNKHKKNRVKKTHLTSQKKTNLGNKFEFYPIKDIVKRLNLSYFGIHARHV